MKASRVILWALAAMLATHGGMAAKPITVVAPPEPVRMDEDVTVTVRGVPRGTVLELQSELVDDSVTWQGRAKFVARGATISPRRDRSIGGTYLGVDPDGLFWSMVPLDSSGAPVPRVEFIALSAENPRHSLVPVLAREKVIPVRLTARTGGRVVGSAIVKRLWMDNDVQRAEIADGKVRGVLYAPRVRRSTRAVILLTGSGGGVDRDWAPLLAARGYSVLALGYFGYKDRPPAPAELPLEYFAEAVSWMKAKVGHSNLALVGISRGTEAAMLTAAHWPDSVKAVVAVAPGHLSTPGFHPEKGLDVSTWSLAGKPIPFASFPPIDLAALSARHGTPATALRQADWYSAMYRRNTNDEAIIPVERMRAPLLLISGSADAIWPSQFSGTFIASRLRRHAYPFEVRHEVIEGAGHTIWMSPNVVTTYAHLGFHRLARAFTTAGGTPARNSAGAETAFEATDAFLRRHLRHGT